MLEPAEVVEEKSVIQEALDNFAALVEDEDFAPELELMGIGRFQFLRRRQMVLELAGLYMALWRLALSHSFPDDAGDMFAVFLHQYLASHPGKQARQIVERAKQYWGMIHPVGDADFSEVARHLTSFLEKDDKDLRAFTLKLALHLRGVYRFIFDRLI